MTNFYKGKVVIVTGASSGIGLASVNHFAALGANVVLAARSIEKLEKITEGLVQQSTSTCQQFLCIKTDVTKEEDCKNLVEKTIEKFGKIDVLVNNAGVAYMSLFQCADEGKVKELFDINLMSAMTLTKEILSSMIRKFMTLS